MLETNLRIAFSICLLIFYAVAAMAMLLLLIGAIRFFIEHRIKKEINMPSEIPNKTIKGYEDSLTPECIKNLFELKGEGFVWL